MTREEVQKETQSNLHSVYMLQSKPSDADTLASIYAVPPEYEEYQKLFELESDQKALSKYQS